MIEIERDILSKWSRLGITWNVPPARRTPDVDLLIVKSMDIIPSNPRMLVLLASWLAIYWRCVGRDRLLAIARKTTPRQQATLGLVLETVDGWEPAFGSVVRKLRPLKTPQPLLAHDQQRPSLAHLAQVEASELSKRWGLWSLPIERRMNALRPVSWVLKVNPALRVRSMFKGTLKTSLLAALDSQSAPMGITHLATQCGVTRKAVYDALEDLSFSGLISKDGHALESTFRHVGRPKRTVVDNGGRSSRAV